jgi:thiol-disulfide isomerase/thioredoxin
VGEIVKEAQRAAATEPDERVIVYVGATWCEPCLRFHQAVERGELDDRLVGVRFLEFDADRDGERLREAGYGGAMIPRFAVPGPEGRGIGVQIEGSVSGEKAVDAILTRLEPMLARADPRADEG